MTEVFKKNLLKKKNKEKKIFSTMALISSSAGIKSGIFKLKISIGGRAMYKSGPGSIGKRQLK